MFFSIVVPLVLSVLADKLTKPYIFAHNMCINTYIMVIKGIRISQKFYDFLKFRTLENNLTMDFAQKTSNLLRNYSCNDALF